MVVHSPIAPDRFGYSCGSTTSGEALGDGNSVDTSHEFFSVAKSRSFFHSPRSLSGSELACSNYRRDPRNPARQFIQYKVEVCPIAIAGIEAKGSIDYRCLNYEILSDIVSRDREINAAH